MRPRVWAAPIVLGLALLLLALIDPPHGAVPSRARADVALVLSGDLDYVRVRRAAALLREGEVSWIVLTGAGAGGDSARIAGDVAIGLGVPRERLVLEERSTSTRENILFAVPLIRAHGWIRVALVTSAFHMGRAERVARKAIPEVTWILVTVPDPGPASAARRARLREWGKLFWYLLRGWA